MLAVHPSVTDSASHNCDLCRAHIHNPRNALADHRKLAKAMAKSHRDEIASFRRHTEHKLLEMRRQVDHAKAEAARALQERDEAVKALTEGFEDGASEMLLTLARDVTLRDLEAKKRSAYRGRDRAMAAVWRIDEIHNARLGGKCACGKVLRTCREYQALAFFRDAFYEWERRQIELMKAGKRHGLPANHPESRKLSSGGWNWRGAPSTAPDERPNRQSA